jgi:hypothetical protein
MKSKRPPGIKRKVGRPTKATPERIQSILNDIACELTREQACACNNVSASQFREWEKRAEFPDLRAKAQATRKLALLKMVEESTSTDWRSAAWLLERNFPQEFGDHSYFPALRMRARAPGEHAYLKHDESTK